ncbi:arylesterase [Wenzhouxiangella sp. XN79A]|uniref:arylesterase n=1 Tax=Wenzhouxiangella sp. XN79A TaxID=2724193 RepID=UPI0032177679
MSRWSVSLWLVAALVAMPASAATVVVLGDSLSDAYGMAREAGWVAHLDEALGPAHRVVDGSISGDTSSGALDRLDGLLNTHPPDVLVVIIGGNDGLRGLAPDRLQANLERIVEQGRALGAEVLLMQVRLPPNLGPRYVRAFEAVYPAVAEATGAEWIPFFLEPLFDQPGMLMDDGIHPTEAAQPRLAELIRPAVEAALARVGEAPPSE